MEYRQITYQKGSELHRFTYLPGDESKLTYILFDTVKDPNGLDFDELDALLLAHIIAPPDLHGIIKNFFKERFTLDSK